MQGGGGGGEGNCIVSQLKSFLGLGKLSKTLVSQL